MIHDFTDDEARRALRLKWGLAAADEIPAWVAEMDYRPAEPITEALTAAVADGVVGYPPLDVDGDLARAYAGFAERQYGQRVDPAQVLPVVDVTAGMRLVVDVLSEQAPVVLPVPAYPPQLDIPEITGRRRVDLLLDPDDERAGLDLDQLDRLLDDGARTLLLTQPHNPWGRVFSRAELEAVRDVVVRHGARVVSDEIHAPLVLPGAEHVSYLDVEGTADHAVALVSASKAFNVPGLRCAQVVTADPATRDRLLAAPDARNDSWSSLGVVASVAAYAEGDAWLAALVRRLDEQRTMLRRLLAEHLPGARMRPLEATYLAWLDLRAYGHDQPAQVMRERGRVWLEEGARYHPGLTGHARLNIATSPDRLAQIVRRMATGLGA